jgi:hypothetical protein
MLFKKPKYKSTYFGYEGVCMLLFYKDINVSNQNPVNNI